MTTNIEENSSTPAGMDDKQYTEFLDCYWDTGSGRPNVVRWGPQNDTGSYTTISVILETNQEYNDVMKIIANNIILETIQYIQPKDNGNICITLAARLEQSLHNKKQYSISVGRFTTDPMNIGPFDAWSIGIFNFIELSKDQDINFTKGIKRGSSEETNESPSRKINKSKNKHDQKAPVYSPSNPTPSLNYVASSSLTPETSSSLTPEALSSVVSESSSSLTLESSSSITHRVSSGQIPRTSSSLTSESSSSLTPEPSTSLASNTTKEECLRIMYELYQAGYPYYNQVSHSQQLDQSQQVEEPQQYYQQQQQLDQSEQLYQLQQLGQSQQIEESQQLDQSQYVEEPHQLVRIQQIEDPINASRYQQTEDSLQSVPFETFNHLQMYHQLQQFNHLQSLEQLPPYDQLQTYNEYQHYGQFQQLAQMQQLAQIQQFAQIQQISQRRNYNNAISQQHASNHSISTNNTPCVINKVQLRIHGDLLDMQNSWSLYEETKGRRIVRFWRRATNGPDGNLSTVECGFEPIEQEEYDRQRTTENVAAPNMMTSSTDLMPATSAPALEPLRQSFMVSCIYWQNKHYLTSVDCIYLLESVIGTKFSVDEKNRIRRNLEGYRPVTVSKLDPKTADFFKHIMNFGPPKPRNIEKDIKVFEWRNLAPAIKKIVRKYGFS